MNLLTISRTALFILLAATIASGAEKTPPAYQKGTILNISSNHVICELQGTGIYKQIKNCGDFQSGQAVEYRVKGDNVYIRRENGKEYKCSIEGTIVAASQGKHRSRISRGRSRAGKRVKTCIGSAPMGSRYRATKPFTN